MTNTVISSPKIAIKNVTKVYQGTSRNVTALDNVSLDIQANEFVVIVGPSGCGKTTLLNIIAGLEKTSDGEVQVDGKPVREPGSDRGVIFQQYALFPWLTVQQNVEFGLKIKGVSRQKRAEIARHYLELVGLKDFPNALPKELSGGMKQRCAIARAYAANPSILLMDEPFAALDALTRVQMQEQLQKTWEQERKTAFFITHDVDEAVFLGTRVIIMKHGGIREETIIDLPFPRDNEMRLSEKFIELRNKVFRGVYLKPEDS
ncbi:MAG: ATP-binding protein [Chloroflexi bacterium]|jgi:NitT/TauT family transport system ATP-binding protein|nr:ATP-binding protein [Chloroflexota bacterium]